MFSRTGLSNPLNKYRSCSLLDFRPFQMIFSQVCINLNPGLQGGGWAGGGEGQVGAGGGEGGGKPPR